MSGCALIEYNNLTARIRGVVAPGDKHYVQFALSNWAVIAFGIRHTDHNFTRISVEEWIEGIAKHVKPSVAREQVFNALLRCKPGIF